MGTLANANIDANAGICNCAARCSCACCDTLATSLLWTVITEDNCAARCDVAVAVAVATDGVIQKDGVKPNEFA